MNMYFIVLNHDNGYTKIKVYATSIRKALLITMKSEGCPEREIESITKIKNKGRKKNNGKT